MFAPCGHGKVAEWLKAPHSKCGIRVTVSGVRIPPSPPSRRSPVFADIHKSAKQANSSGLFRLYTFTAVRHNPRHNCGLVRGRMAMARTIGRLTALKVDKAKRPGMYADGGGLYLRVTQSGTKHWVFRFMLNGRPRWMGVGPLHTIGLAEARNRAAVFRLQRHDGVDPIESRRAER